MDFVSIRSKCSDFYKQILHLNNGPGRANKQTLETTLARSGGDLRGFVRDILIKYLEFALFGCQTNAIRA
jgi:hypothetical protein